MAATYLIGGSNMVDRSNGGNRGRGSHYARKDNTRRTTTVTLDRQDHANQSASNFQRTEKRRSSFSNKELPPEDNSQWYGEVADSFDSGNLEEPRNPTAARIAEKLRQLEEMRNPPEEINPTQRHTDIGLAERILRARKKLAQAIDEARKLSRIVLRDPIDNVGAPDDVPPEVIRGRYDDDGVVVTSFSRRRYLHQE